MTATENDCALAADEVTGSYDIVIDGDHVSLTAINNASPQPVTWTGSAGDGSWELSVDRTMDLAGCVLEIRGEMTLTRDQDELSGSNRLHQSWCNGTECDVRYRIRGTPSG